MAYQYRVCSLNYWGVFSYCVVRPYQGGYSLDLCTSPADQCLLHLYLLTWLTFLISKCLPTYLSQLLIVLVKGVLKGERLCWFPWWNQWARLISIPPVIGNLPFPPGAEIALVSCILCPACCLPHTEWGVAPRPCLRLSSSPYSLKQWHLCHSLWALSSVLKLIKDRTCSLPVEAQQLVDQPADGRNFHECQDVEK